MKNLVILNKKVRFTTKAGVHISKALSDARDFCLNFNTEVELTFNGKTRTITEFTNIEDAAEKWQK
jgi:plasmid maintenance system antidote protein VapI